MLQGKLGMYKPLVGVPPFVQMQAALACKCANGFHVVLTNSFAGQEPTCHCEPDEAQTSSGVKVPDKPLNAPNGYHYVYDSITNAWYLQPNYNYNAANYPQTGVPVINTVNANNTSGMLDTIKNAISEHPYIVGAAVLGVGYMALSGGLAASDRTITSVTRYAPRKRNGIKRRANKRRNKRR